MLKMVPNSKHEEYELDDLGFAFVRKCISVIEARGLEDQGLYRVGGANSKVMKLMRMALDRRKLSSDGEIMLDINNHNEWEIRTVTSALKQYFRNLPEPLMTFRLHDAFISAASMLPVSQLCYGLLPKDLLMCTSYTLYNLSRTKYVLIIFSFTHLLQSKKAKKNKSMISTI